MTIASEITRINNNIAATYTALSAKGATMPATENSANLASTVATVPSGGSVDPSRLLFEVNSGVASKPAVTLNANSFAGITSIGKDMLKNAYSRSNVNGNVSFTDLTTIGETSLFCAFFQSGITSISFPSLSAIPGKGSGFYGICDQMCSGCTSLTSADFPELVSIGTSGLSNGFKNATQLNTVNFPKLNNIGTSGLEYAFQNVPFTGKTISFTSLENVSQSGMSSAFRASSLETISFPSLTTIGYIGLQYCFRDCAYLATASFPSLTTVGNGGLDDCFYNCTSLTTISFPSLTTVGSNGFWNCFYGCTNLTSIHFPAAIQSDIEATQGYSSKFGATNATIYFDL